MCMFFSLFVCYIQMRKHTAGQRFNHCTICGIYWKGHWLWAYKQLSGRAGRIFFSQGWGHVACRLSTQDNWQPHILNLHLTDWPSLYVALTFVEVDVTGKFLECHLNSNLLFISIWRKKRYKHVLYFLQLDVFDRGSVSKKTNNGKHRTWEA